MARAGAAMTGNELVRVRVGRYRCVLAAPLADAEMRQLVAALASPVFAAPGVLGGRGAVRVHDIGLIGPVVIKEYRHGGMLRPFLGRYYLRRGPTRPERELEILRDARAAGLHVPEPVASLSLGNVMYRGWLVTRLIAGQRSLADIARHGREPLEPLVDLLLEQVRLLIDHRIAHADLHPGNVVVDERGRLHLVDFDRANRFEGSVDDLAAVYLGRWHRAVAKHQLPGVLSDRVQAAFPNVVADSRIFT
jgi:tRNA A-37 threonylcarbamoyl transferase component Bud32